MNRPAWLDRLRLDERGPAHPKLAKPALAAGLALLLAAELTLAGSPPAATRAALSIPPGKPDQVDAAAIDRWGDTVLARPLFTASRRPGAPPGADIVTVLPRLSAVIVVGGVRRAVFVAAGEKSQVIGEGETIGSYTLKAIGPDSVVLIGPNGQVTQRPQFITPGAAANTSS